MNIFSRPAAPPAPAPRRSWFGRLFRSAPATRQPTVTEQVHEHAISLLPRSAHTGDSGCLKAGGPLGTMRGMDSVGLNQGVMDFFAGQALPLNFHACAMLGTHWLIDKALRMPAEDAVRQGWDLSDPDPRILKADKKLRIKRELADFIAGGRQFGLRFAMFLVDSDNPKFYEYPFNPDGVTPGSYRGMSQIDPYWCAPYVTDMDMTDPTRKGFYEPEWWIIGGRKIHKSHLVVFRNGEVADYLKPMYRYGGVSVTQRIVERVYNAERTANEAPELAMTKRTTTIKLDLAEAEMSDGAVESNLADFVRFRNNYGVKILGPDDEMGQHDTSLADFDSVVMNQYQLVAAAANVPATKLLGTTPKGFNATGEYEEAAYHEMLESLQTNQGDAFLDRHYQLLGRSLGITDPIEHTWNPLDSPTAKEYAETELIRAQRDAQLQMAGAIDSEDIRERLGKDRDGDYFGLTTASIVDETDDS